MFHHMGPGTLVSNFGLWFWFLTLVLIVVSGFGFQVGLRFAVTVEIWGVTYGLRLKLGGMAGYGPAGPYDPYESISV